MEKDCVALCMTTLTISPVGAGDFVGDLDGTADGVTLAPLEGFDVAPLDGFDVGTIDGLALGDNDGHAKSATFSLIHSAWEKRRHEK